MSSFPSFSTFSFDASSAEEYQFSTSPSSSFVSRPNTLKKPIRKESQPISTEPETSRPTSSKKRKQVPLACVACRKAKCACCHERPCRRCAANGVPCIDVPRRRRSKSNPVRSLDYSPIDEDEEYIEEEIQPRVSQNHRKRSTSMPIMKPSQPSPESEQEHQQRNQQQQQQRQADIFAFEAPNPSATFNTKQTFEFALAPPPLLVPFLMPMTVPRFPSSLQAYEMEDAVKKEEDCLAAPIPMQDESVLSDSFNLYCQMEDCQSVGDPFLDAITNQLYSCSHDVDSCQMVLMSP